MKTTDKIISFFKRLETLSNDEWIELDLKMNEYVHDESKNTKLSEMIEKSKKELNDQERYSFEASIHRSATNLFVFNEKNLTEERVSLYLLPISLVWNEAHRPKTVESFFDKQVNIEKILKQYKLIDRKSTAVFLPHLISFNQLENSKIKDLSDYLKNFVQTEDILNLQLPAKFEADSEDVLFIPLIISESVFTNNVFIDNYDNLDSYKVAEISEVLSNELSSENCLIIPEKFSEFHESLSSYKSFLFFDQVMYHLEQANALKIPIKTIYLIKQANAILFSATDNDNNEIYNISITSNSERILMEMFTNSHHSLVEENQVKLLKEEINVLTFNYIGHLS